MHHVQHDLICFFNVLMPPHVWPFSFLWYLLSEYIGLNGDSPSKGLFYFIEFHHRAYSNAYLLFDNIVDDMTEIVVLHNTVALIALIQNLWSSNTHPTTVALKCIETPQGGCICSTSQEIWWNFAVCRVLLMFIIGQYHPYLPDYCTAQLYPSACEAPWVKCMI